jgi:hypothetical protein
VGTIVQVGWIAGTGDDPGVGRKVGPSVGWSVALAAGVVAAIWCAIEWRDRASSITAPPPPVPVG